MKLLRERLANFLMNSNNFSGNISSMMMWLSGELASIVNTWFQYDLGRTVRTVQIECSEGSIHGNFLLWDFSVLLGSCSEVQLWLTDPFSILFLQFAKFNVIHRVDKVNTSVGILEVSTFYYWLLHLGIWLVKRKLKLGVALRYFSGHTRNSHSGAKVYTRSNISWW